jgi:2-keto-4-pentenoate hydratase/2-oxohepta-3-ene-1,7-dioic acid hydratase in catechol pathway
MSIGAFPRHHSLKLELNTGTPAGVGFTRKPPVVIKHGGDVVEVSIEGGIGTMTNHFVEDGRENW